MNNFERFNHIKSLLSLNIQNIPFLDYISNLRTLDMIGYRLIRGEENPQLTDCMILLEEEINEKIVKSNIKQKFIFIDLEIKENCVF